MLHGGGGDLLSLGMSVRLLGAMRLQLLRGAWLTEFLQEPAYEGMTLRL